MGQLRTANKRHNRAMVAQQIARSAKAAEAAGTRTAEPAAPAAAA